MFSRVVTSLCSCQQCALAAVIIVNLKGMFIQVTDLKKLWYISKYDFVSIVILRTSDASKKKIFHCIDARSGRESYFV